MVVGTIVVGTVVVISGGGVTPGAAPGDDVPFMRGNPIKDRPAMNAITTTTPKISVVFIFTGNFLLAAI
jgi:hypothetical protein